MNNTKLAKQVTVVADEDTLNWLYDRAVDIFEEGGILAVTDEKDVMYNTDLYEIIEDHPLVHREVIKEMD